MPDPGSGHPHRVNKRGHDVYAWHPDILNAVPAPVARLPDIAGSRRRGRHLDHRSGWGKADHDPDAGGAGSSGEDQRRGAEKGKDRSSPHGGLMEGLPANTSLRAEQATGREWVYP
jgi:hypothetical protein